MDEMAAIMPVKLGTADEDMRPGARPLGPPSWPLPCTPPPDTTHQDGR
jgi:hypothetical protein